MSAPPSYRTVPSTEDFDADIRNLTTGDKKELLDATSEISAEDDQPAPSYTSTYHPSKSFLINSRGIALLRLPLPSSELEIPIYTSSGTLAYTSTREKKRSGNAILSAPDRGDLVASSYRFGPGRNPTMTLLQEPTGSNEILVSGKWTSRAQTFTYAAVPINFEWRYTREVVDKPSASTEPADEPSADSAEAPKDKSKDKSKPKKRSLVVLEVEGKKKGDVRRVAQLLRDEETRPAGTHSSTAGNGGELGIDDLAAKGLGIPEELIIASCVMMLKKEIDRRRALQFAMISGGASGGS